MNLYFSPWKPETDEIVFFHLKINLQIPLAKNPGILTLDEKTLKEAEHEALLV